MLLRIIPGRSTVRKILRRAVKMDEPQAVGHIYICNCVTFSCGLDSQRLDTQCYADTRATIDLLWKVSLVFRSPHHPWSTKMQAVHKDSRPGQSVFCSFCASDRHWPLRNVGLCVNTDFVILLSATVSIVIFHQPSWRMAMITIKNNTEPNLHGIMIRHLCKLPWCSGRFRSLVITYAENTVTHILGGKVVAGQWYATDWKMILTQS